MTTTDIREDSEGMLVTSGGVRYKNTIGQWESKDFVCRYDPEQDSVLWVKYLPNPENSNGRQVLEKQPGGNYLFCRVFHLTSGEETEMMEINRQTGAIVSNSAKKLGLNASTELSSVLAYKGALYAAGTQSRYEDIRGDYLLCKMNLAGTQTLWANTGPGIPEPVGGRSLLIDQDTLVSLYVGRDTLPNSQSKSLYIYLQKTTLNGALVWVRRYELPGLARVEAYDLLASNTGYLIFGVEQNKGDGFILSTNKAGHIQQSCRIPTPAPFQHYRSGSIENVAVVLGESFYLAGGFYGSTNQPSFRSFSKGMLLKSDLALSDIDSCPFAPLTSSVIETTPANPTATPISLVFSPSNSKAVDIPVFIESASISERTDCVRCDAPCGPPLSLGPDREFFADTTVLLQAGPGYAAYLWQDGSTLPHYSAQPGNTYWVQVTDGCGFAQRDSVRLAFSETVCDRKDLGCIRWELLDVRAVASGDLRFRVKLTNSCASGLQHVSFQVPAGLTATQPLGQSTYTAQPSGRTYAVRNPNYSPFYSVRFSASGSTPLSGGAFDVFEYQLPAQAAPAYIGTAVKLEDGSTYSALLNTFNCPPASAQERSEGMADWVGGSLLWPNPNAGTLWLDLSSWKNQVVQVRILNAQGQVLQIAQLTDKQALILDAHLADGLYYAVLQPENEAPVTLRFVVER